MEIIYSKLEPNKILHIVHRGNEFNNIKEGHRKDIVDPEEFIQLSALKMKKGQTFQPHQHIWKDGEKKVIAQESWVVIKGSVKCSFFIKMGMWKIHFFIYPTCSTRKSI